MGVMASFIVGLPGDTPDTFRQIADFVNEAKPIGVMLNIFTPLPGSQAAAEMLSSGRVMSEDWGYYDARWAVCNPGTMSPRDVEQAFDNLNREVFSWQNMSDRFSRVAKRKKLEHSESGSYENTRQSSRNRFTGKLRALARIGLDIAERRDAGQCAFALRMIALAMGGTISLGRACAFIVQGTDWHDYALSLAERPLAGFHTSDTDSK
jgi:hypothetical protein